MANANHVTQTEAASYLALLRAGYLNVPAATVFQDCILHCKSPSEQRYAKTKLSGHGRDEFYIHHLVIRSTDALVESSKQVSHLCHQKRCINAAHFVQESGEENRARQMCVGATMLQVVCECGRVHTINPCRHIPKCVLHM